MSKSDTQVLDFQKICRLCLVEKRSMSSIFSKKKSDKKVPLPIRIMTCASLELYEGDGLPASICSRCLTSVNQSFAFREQCEQADSTLRQYAQQMNNETSTTSVEDDGSSSAVAQAKTSVTGEASTCPDSEEKVKFESATAFDYLRLEVGGSSPARVTSPSAIKTESIKQEDSIQSDLDDNWTEDDVEPLANIRGRGTPNSSTKEAAENSKKRGDCSKESNMKNEKTLTPTSTVIKIPKVKAEKESRSPKIKIPKPPKLPKIKPPKKPRVLKPLFIDCEVCGKSVQRRKFKLHMMVHNGEKPHLCDTCGKSFTWKFALVTHKRVHSGEKPYLCKHCGQSFRSSSRFAEHSTIHTGRRSYVCEHCALAFRTSGRLKRHLRIHTGEKPYKCSFCERGFSESYNLKQHLRLHTGEKPPHVCSICTQAFIRKKMLVDHLRIHHGILSPAPHMLMITKSDNGGEDMGVEDSKMTQESKLSDDYILPHPTSVININITFD